MWCDKHARWCAHTTDACTLGTKGGKAGKGGPRQHLDTRTPYYPTAPVYPPGAGPYNVTQDEREKRRIREVLAETVPEKATWNCTTKSAPLLSPLMVMPAGSIDSAGSGGAGADPAAMRSTAEDKPANMTSQNERGRKDTNKNDTFVWVSI